jgi:hypothetical protein
MLFGTRRQNTIKPIVVKTKVANTVEAKAITDIFMLWFEFSNRRASLPVEFVESKARTIF